LDNSKDTLGAVIKDARLKRDITQKELAMKLNISQKHLTSIENGKSKPGYELLCKLILELFIPADQIFHPEAPHDRAELERAISSLRECSDNELHIINNLIQSLSTIRQSEKNKFEYGTS
jgi:transcriptional regulator with XRE-family HTH domain